MRIKQAGGKSMGVLDVVKAYTPWAIRRASHRVKREVRWARNARQPVSKVFEDVYNQSSWGGEQGKFYSGPGSDGNAARIYAQGIEAFLNEWNISSVVDLGCGDFRVASRFLNDEISYVGIDIVESLVHENLAKHRSEKISFACLDIIKDQLPEGELCLIREVFQHLSNAEILEVMPKLRQFRYVVYTDHQPGPGARCIPNRDISHGVDTRIWLDSALFLDQPPFNADTQLLFETPASTNLRNPGEQLRTYLLRP
ncbi:MAG: class I SAM-dependent methyltransferase [Acetobacteraceae bacterium]